MGKPVNPVWAQEDYAFYQSDGTTLVGAGSQQNLDVDTIYYVRLAIGDTNGTNQSAQDLTIQMQYLHTQGGNTWTQFGTSDGSGTPVDFANGSLTDGASTSNSGDVTGTGTFNAGRVYESSNTTAVVYTLPTNETTSHTEIVVGFSLASAAVANGDEVLIRATFGDGTAFTTYTNADINVVEATTYPGTASFTGAGTVSATGDAILTYGGTASFTGSGTLSATGQHIQTYAGTASFAGAGTFSGVGAYIPGATVYPGTASFGGAGSVSGVGSLVYSSTASFTGAGTLVSTPSTIRSASSSFSGSGSLSTTPNTIYSGTASFDGAGSFSGTGQLIGTYPGTADFAGSGTLTTTPNAIYGGVAGFTGTGSVTATGDQIVKYFGTASFGGAASLSAAGSQVHGATASFGAAGSVSAAGQVQYQGIASFDGAGTFSGVGQYLSNTITYDAIAIFAGSGGLATTPSTTYLASASFTGTGSFVASNIQAQPTGAAIDWFSLSAPKDKVKAIVGLMSATEEQDSFSAHGTVTETVVTGFVYAGEQSDSVSAVGRVADHYRGAMVASESSDEITIDITVGKFEQARLEDEWLMLYAQIPFQGQTESNYLIVWYL